MRSSGGNRVPAPSRDPGSPANPHRLHFSGIAGSGMSALAQFHVLRGGKATGSDRAFDQAAAGAPNPGAAAIRRHLEDLGIEIFPQDGSGLDAGCDAIVVSTAVEETVPDLRTARERGIRVLHRAELLASFVRENRTIAVTGTSGKSTVTAMIFEILRAAGRSPSVITGGDLLLLQDEEFLGNAWAGEGALLVIEADESDGSLVHYEPWCGVLLNLQRDHKEPEELAGIFDTFRRNTRGPFVVGEDRNLDRFAEGAIRFGLGPSCEVRAEDIELTPDGSRFTVDGVTCALPTPGLHNVLNALAALAACQACGVSPAEAAPALQRFRGVARRFQRVGRVNGIEIIDDFAHNPAKIAASLATARLRGKRILAIFQPHGFGPTRFLRDDLIHSFVTGLTPRDRLYMPEIFYAGGTATKDISSRDIIEQVALAGIPSHFAESREELIDRISAGAQPGDVILVMGARDPSLPEFCREILRKLEGRQESEGTR